MSATERSHRRSVRVRIEGRVQGVGYRHWTERIAGELELAGWVRNRGDGSVEAVFAGPDEVVAQMLELCREGPYSAQVTGLTILEDGVPAPAIFQVLPTA